MNAGFPPKLSVPNGFPANRFVSGKARWSFVCQGDRKGSKESGSPLDKSPFGFFSDCSADPEVRTTYNYLLSKVRRCLFDQWFFRLVSRPYHAGTIQISSNLLSQKYHGHRTVDTSGGLDLCNVAPNLPKSCRYGFANFFQNARGFSGLNEMRKILSSIYPCLVSSAIRLLKIPCRTWDRRELLWGEF